MNQRNIKNFDKIILTHTCREIPDLAFSQMVLGQRENDGLLSKSDIASLEYYPTVTRDKPTDDIKSGRITDLILSRKFFKDLNIEDLFSVSDRVMLCGSQSFNTQMKGILIKRGFLEGSINDPGDFVLEKAFVGG